MSIIKKKELCEYKDINFEIELDYYYDQFLDEYYVDAELGNLNLKRIRNEYRRIKDLLSDDEIKEIRSQYNLSQRDFSIALGFGEVTITRYESKTVQDKTQDKIIRESKNPVKFLYYMEQNKDKFIKMNGIKKYNELYNNVLKLSKNIEFAINQYSSEQRGFTFFKMSKLKAVINEIKKYKYGLTKTFLAKMLWYIDSLGFRENKQSLTGLVYISMPYGAYPDKYDKVLSDGDITIKVLWHNDYECHFIEHIESDDILTKEEKKIIEYVMTTFKDYSAEKIVEFMHREKAYTETALFDIISYEFSKDIEIFNDYKN